MKHTLEVIVQRVPDSEIAHVIAVHSSNIPLIRASTSSQYASALAMERTSHCHYTWCSLVPDQSYVISSEGRRSLAVLRADCSNSFPAGCYDLDDPAYTEVDAVLTGFAVYKVRPTLRLLDRKDRLELRASTYTYDVFDRRMRQLYGGEPFS